MSYLMLYSAGFSKGSLECRILLLMFRAPPLDRGHSHAVPDAVCSAVAIVADV